MIEESMIDSSATEMKNSGLEDFKYSFGTNPDGRGMAKMKISQGIPQKIDSYSNQNTDNDYFQSKSKELNMLDLSLFPKQGLQILKKVEVKDNNKFMIEKESKLGNQLFQQQQMDTPNKSLIQSNINKKKKSQNSESLQSPSPFRNLQIKQLTMRDKNETIFRTALPKKSIFKKQEQMNNVMRMSLKLFHFFKQKTSSGRVRFLNDEVRKKLNDKADYVQNQEKKSYYSKVSSKFSKNLGLILGNLSIPLFNPEQKWRIGFNSIIVIFNCFYLYIISLKIAFSNGQILTWQHTLQQVAQVVWILDMIIQMNTAMYHNNKFTKDRRIIMKIFIKEYFFFEVLPIIFENMHSSNLYINILFHLPLLLKMKGIMIMLDNLEFYILQILENQSIFLLLKLFMQMILFGHILACCRNTVIQYELFITQDHVIWSQGYIFYELDKPFVNYLQNMFWAFTLMLNVSHPIPTTSFELIFTSCCMLISCIAFGYLLSSVGNILSQLNKGSEDYKKDLTILNNYMKRKNIDIGLKRRANISLKSFYDQQQRIKISEERETLDKVDNRLLKELLISSNLRNIKLCPLFTNVFSQRTLEQICMNFEELYYTPNQNIIECDGRYSDENYLYLVVEGKVQIYENYDRVLVTSGIEKERLMSLQQRVVSQFSKGNYKYSTSQYLQQNSVIIDKGQYFGLMNFMLNKQFITKAQSLSYSTVLRISTTKVDKILQNSVRDRENFQELKDKLIYNNDLSQLQIECAFCTSRKHLSQDCYLIHFDKNNKFIHFKNNYSPLQERNTQIVRKKQKDQNALLIQKQLIEEINELRSNYDLKSTRKIDESDFNMQDEYFLTTKKISTKDLSQLENEQKSILSNVDHDDKRTSIHEALFQQYNEDSLPKKKRSKVLKNDQIELIKQQTQKKDYQNYCGDELVNDEDIQVEDINIQLNNQQYLPSMDQTKSPLTFKISHQKISSSRQLQLLQPQLQNNSEIFNHDKEDEQLTYNIIDDEANTKGSIKYFPSNILVNVNHSYFEESNIQVVQQGIPHSQIPSELVLKKQQTSHTSKHKRMHENKNRHCTQVVTINAERQNSLMTNSQKFRQKGSLQNTGSFSRTSSLANSVSLNRDNRSHVGSKRDISPKKMKSKLNQYSTLQSHVKQDNIIGSKVFTHNLIDDDHQEYSDKQEKQQQPQRISNHNKIFYWYFDKTHNFQYYFRNQNSNNYIYKYNLFLQQKKKKLKVKKNPSYNKKEKNSLR